MCDRWDFDGKSVFIMRRHEFFTRRKETDNKEEARRDRERLRDREAEV